MAQKMRIGCDPGISGAIAVLNDELQCLDCQDMPTMALGKTHTQVNSAALAKLFLHWAVTISGNIPPTVYLEQVSAMPHQGVVSMFNFGMSYGIVQGVLAALQIPMVLVRPAVWKKRAGLIGKDKDYCRTLMQQLYPQIELGRKKDIGRADSIAIARFGSE